MNKYLAMFCLSLVAFNCSAEDADKAQIQKAIRNYLINRSPTTFGAYTKVNNMAACVSVKTATTDMQSLVDVEASLVKVKGAWQVMNLQKMTHEACTKIMSDMTGNQAHLGQQQQ